MSPSASGAATAQGRAARTDWPPPGRSCSLRGYDLEACSLGGVVHRSKGAPLIGIALACGAIVVTLVAVAAALTEPGGRRLHPRHPHALRGRRIEPAVLRRRDQPAQHHGPGCDRRLLRAAHRIPPADRSRRFSLFGAFVFVLAADDVRTLHESGPRRLIPEGGVLRRSTRSLRCSWCSDCSAGNSTRRRSRSSLGGGLLWPPRSSSTRPSTTSTSGRTRSSSPAVVCGSSSLCSN